MSGAFVSNVRRARRNLDFLRTPPRLETNEDWRQSSSFRPRCVRRTGGGTHERHCDGTDCPGHRGSIVMTTTAGGGMTSTQRGTKAIGVGTGADAAVGRGARVEGSSRHDARATWK